MRLEAAPEFSGSMSGVRPQIPRQEQTRKSVLKNMKAKNVPGCAQLSSKWAEPTPGATNTRDIVTIDSYTLICKITSDIQHACHRSICIKR